MLWNWQQPEWPLFSWDASRLVRAEQRFLLERGVSVGLARHLPSEEASAAIVEVLTEESLGTSAIEGEILDRASVQSSVQRELGRAADTSRATPAERGIARLMTGVHRFATAPLDESTLLGWHATLLQGRAGLRDLGRWRTGDEPMRVVSGRVGAPRIHFEAPPSARVADEMRAFLQWFAATAPQGPRPLPPIARAGLAHLWFESIHPFEDGNGRLGRAISEKALAGAVDPPQITALAATILARRREYYVELEAASRSCQADRWLRWFAGVVLEAQLRTRAGVEFLIDKARYFEALTGDVGERPRRVLARVLREGPRGFEGGLSAGNYATIARVSPATATRDLAALVDAGGVVRTGERRHARYWPRVARRSIPRVTLDDEGNVVEDGADPV